MRPRALLGVVVFLGATAGLAAASGMGDGYWAVCGDCRSRILGSGSSPEDHFMNWRVDLQGAPADGEGTGRILLFDRVGQRLWGEAPFAWATKKGRSFRADFLSEEFADILGERYFAGTGGPTDVVLTRARGRGVLRDEGESLTLTVNVRGTVSRDGEAARKLKMRMRLK